MVNILRTHTLTLLNISVVRTFPGSAYAIQRPVHPPSLANKYIAHSPAGPRAIEAPNVLPVRFRVAHAEFTVMRPPAFYRPN